MSLSLSILTTLAIAAAAFAQQVTEKTVPGVTNFKNLETTIACAGATTAQAVPELKKMGYASIINLRISSSEIRLYPGSLNMGEGLPECRSSRNPLGKAKAVSALASSRSVNSS